MKHLPKIGTRCHPETFKYEPVLVQGQPEHCGDSFSVRHPHMDYGKRAKIFAPFAALKGFEEEVQSKDVRYERKRELDADALYELNHRLYQLQERTRGRLAKQNLIRAQVEYFVPCEDAHQEAFHSRGQYVTIEEIIYQVDEVLQVLRIGDHMIPFQDIYAIRFAEEDERSNTQCIMQTQKGFCSGTGSISE